MLVVAIILLSALAFWNEQHFPLTAAAPSVQATTTIIRLDKSVTKGVRLETQTGQAATTTVVGDVAWVARVVDGDTIELADGERVRYIGMDTPETVDPRKPVQCYGHEASAYNKNLVENKQVVLVADQVDKDKYGRLLRYVYLTDGTFVNLTLVEQGYARVLTIPPNDSLTSEFIAAAHEARAAGRGLWTACGAST